MRQPNRTKPGAYQPSCEILLSLQPSQIDVLFNNLIHRPWGYACWQPLIDVIESADSYTILMDLPGTDPESVCLAVKDRTLTVEGCRQAQQLPQGTARFCCSERPRGIFRRTVKIDSDVDPEPDRRYEQGVLTVTLRKIEGGSQ